MYTIHVNRMMVLVYAYEVYNHIAAYWVSRILNWYVIPYGFI